MINLKEAYGNQYKIFMDESWEYMEPKKEEDKPWYYEIKGRYGHVYLYDENVLAVDVTSAIIAQKVKREMDSKLSLFISRDDGGVFLFDSRYLEEVAGIIRLRKKRQGRQLSPEEKEKLANRGREALKRYRELTCKCKITAQI